MSKSPVAQSESTSFGVRDAARHMLYSGTLVLQTRAESAGDATACGSGVDGVRALVVRTGFASAKGELLRAMLHPKPLDFVYERHAWYLAGGLALLGLAGVVYALYVEVRLRCCSLTPIAERKQLQMWLFTLANERNCGLALQVLRVYYCKL